MLSSAMYCCPLSPKILLALCRFCMRVCMSSSKCASAQGLPFVKFIQEFERPEHFVSIEPFTYFILLFLFVVIDIVVVVVVVVIVN